MTTIKVPSEYNKYNWELNSGEPLDTEGMPFYFYYLDSCGNKELADISAHVFYMDIYYNDCLYLSLNGQNMVVEDSNKLYLKIPSLDLKSGLYTYAIRITGGVSVISGEIRIL